MAQYTYLTTDLAGNILTELELSSVSYQRKLTDSGAFSGQFIVDPSKDILDVRLSTLPGRTGLYILRDNTPMWGGIIWKRTYDPLTRTVQLSGSTFESYFDHRFQNLTIVYDEDQIDIARALVTPVASDINLQIDQTTSSNIIRVRTMFDYEYKTRGEELNQLANLINGFDYNVDVFFGTDGSLQQQLNFGYPQLGVTADQSGLVFEYPGNVAALSVSEDAESGGNVVYALGGGEGENMLVSVSANTTSIANGYPPLEVSRSYKTVVSPITLQGHSDSDLVALNPPIELFSLTVIRPDSDPLLGEYVPGDFARFIIDDNWLGHLDFSSRITGFTVQVSDDGTPETVALNFDATERTDDGTVETVQ